MPIEAYDIDSEEAEKLYDLAIKKWGLGAQVLLLAEEAVELAHAALHMHRGAADCNSKLAEEMADVKIMMAQIEYGYSKVKFSSFVENNIKWKLKRLKDRVEN